MSAIQFGTARKKSGYRDHLQRRMDCPDRSREGEIGQHDPNATREASRCQYIMGGRWRDRSHSSRKVWFGGTREFASNAKAQVETKDKNGLTALMAAASVGSERMVRELLEAHAHHEVQDPQ